MTAKLLILLKRQYQNQISEWINKKQNRIFVLDPVLRNGKSKFNFHIFPDIVIILLVSYTFWVYTKSLEIGLAIQKVSLMADGSADFNW